MKVLITGASGLVGSKIVSLCRDENIDVHFLTTKKKKLKNNPKCKGFYWNPNKGEIDGNCINGVDKIIHLAGASVFKRWTKSQKNKILDSRLKSTFLLYNLLTETSHQVTQIISASAIGIYPDSIEKLYHEENQEVANTFLGNTVVKWERCVDEFWKLGIEVAKIRIGIVLAENGGALYMLKKTIKSNFGAVLGKGNQWQSWIHIDDLARMFLFALKNNLDGVYNAVAPNPVTQKQLVEAVAKHLDKHIWLPKIPTFVLKFTLGQMSQIVLSSQLVSNKKIDTSGFIFYYNYLEPALDDLI